MKLSFPRNTTPRGILTNMLLAAVSLFVNGFGVYLTIRAGIGSAPWDVLNLGLSHTFRILYGTASIAVSFAVLAVDLALHEPIGIAMLIDAVTVGKSVDFFNYIDAVPVPKTIAGSVVMLFAGLFILGYTQYTYMASALGCGPRDTLIVGLKRRTKRLPIGGVTVALHVVVTTVGWLLGGPVGLGTVLCVCFSGPIMQLAFRTVGFDATGIRHQNIPESLKIFFGKKE